MKRYSTIVSVLATLALPAAGICAEAPAAPPAAAPAVAAPAPAAPTTQPSSDAKVESIKKDMSKSKHSMVGGSVAAPGTSMDPTGKVLETMNGGGYTYAKLAEKGKKETWVAFSTMETHVGDVLSFKGCMEMPNFQSKALNRTFESILFCGEPEFKSKAMAQKKSPGSGGSVVASTGKINVEKATGPNAYTVAEIFAKRGALNGKQVVVKGKVVKTASGIMNKNWIHLQDGTGSDKQKNNDLVVTSDQLPANGDIVTMSGTVAKDKDFGSGYKYNVIVEKGVVKK